jgi:2-polyprenyl-3-methyl-5-hydroxy-6-metoxy-1,4-benzoquinol methylase
MMPLDFSQRATELEWMDNHELSPRELKEVMNFLSLTNRYLGGSQTILSVLGHWEKFWQKGDTIRFLDVGTGGADIPLAIRRWASSRPYHVSITGIDKVPEIVEFARQRVRKIREITISQADVFAWAAAGHSYDYVIGSLFLHHIPDVQIPGLLRCWDLMARRGLIVSDLIRSRWAYWSVSLLSAIAGNRVVQNDGPLSVLRSFSRSDLERYRNLAALPYLEIRHRMGFRWTLAGEKGGRVAQKALDPSEALPKGRVAFSPGLSSKGISPS